MDIDQVGIEEQNNYSKCIIWNTLGKACIYKQMHFAALGGIKITCNYEACVSGQFKMMVMIALMRKRMRRRRMV